MASFALFGPQHNKSVDPAQIVLVPEKFSIWAFLFPLPYSLWHRNWRFSTLLIVIGLLGSLMPMIAHLPMPETTLIGLELLMGLYCGFAAADIRAAALERRGYLLLDVTVAPNDEAAFLRYLDQSYHATNQHRAPMASTTQPMTQPTPHTHHPAYGSEVLGLFPESHR